MSEHRPTDRPCQARPAARAELPRAALLAFTTAGTLLSSLAMAHQTDPFASAAPGASAAGAQPAVAAVVAGLSCEHLTSAVCGKQNTMMIGVALGYVAACVAVGLIWRASWTKKGHGSAFAQFFAPMALAASGAASLVGFDPARSDDLRCCLASSVFRPEVFLQASTPARVVVLGVLPAVVLYTVGVFVMGAARR
ncbi:MAG: hypothetical protein IT374_05720 [Polyangiaceae bacterium]|nr:hypothetical protein [Polyangiaceae bacterium]